jgi:DNA-binding MarR family transcriptional regulator
MSQGRRNRVSAPPNDLKSLFRDCHRALQAHVHAALLAAGYTDLRPAHANALQFVDDQGSRIQEMATRAQVSWQAMGDLVSDLEGLGYLTRKPDPSDGRARLICLTEKGRELTPVAIGAMREVEAQWARYIGGGGLDELRQTLQHLWRHLGEPN